MKAERRSYYKDDDFEVVLEHADGRVFVHVGIDRATKGAIKRIQQKWGEVVFKVYRAGFTELYTYTDDPRIVRMIGGAELIGKTELHEVYKWDLA